MTGFGGVFFAGFSCDLIGWTGSRDWFWRSFFAGSGYVLMGLVPRDGLHRLRCSSATPGRPLSLSFSPYKGLVKAGEADSQSRVIG